MNRQKKQASKHSEAMQAKIEMMKVEWKKYETKVLAEEAAGSNIIRSAMRKRGKEYAPPRPGTARWNDMLKRINKAQKLENQETVDATAKTTATTSPEQNSKLKDTWWKKQWYMYILESLGRPGLPYVGITTDINRRAGEHNSRGKGGKGNGSWFTSFNGPWKMVCNITGFNLTGFRACELKLKSIMPKSKYTGASGKILALIYCLSHQDEFWDKPKKYPISEGDYKVQVVQNYRHLWDPLNGTANVDVQILDESNFKIDEKTQALIDRQKQLSGEQKNRREMKTLLKKSKNQEEEAEIHA